MKLLAALICAGFLVLGGCSRDETSSGMGQVTMYLTDSPASFDAVNIVVNRVEVHQVDADSGSGWAVINNTPYTYNLLSLKNGQTAILGNAPLSAGTYTQIRLIIGAGSNVVVGGVSFNLDISSGAQTGLKLNHRFTINADGTYDLTVDFDAERSITLTGAGQYKLNPVIRVQANAAAGNIVGFVQPAGVSGSVWTVAGNDTISTIANGSGGSFQLIAVPQGVYSLFCSRQSLPMRDTIVTGVVVNARQTTNVGTITFP